MRLLIVSGMSGSGKSIALNALEDLGFHCIDNLPLSLLHAFVTQMFGAQRTVPLDAAVGIDVRNLNEDLQTFPAILQQLRTLGVECETVFLGADDEVLLKRFSETRRKHPLALNQVSLAEAIRRERQLLAPVSGQADLFIDTSNTNVNQLRALIHQRFESRHTKRMSMLIESFGYKYGTPADADFIFDMRCLPNPHWEPELRLKTGLDPEVMEFLARQPLVSQMLDSVEQFLLHWLPHFEQENRLYLTVAIGCTGGQHRSVYIAQQLAERLKAAHDNTLVRHRELS